MNRRTTLSKSRVSKSSTMGNAEAGNHSDRVVFGDLRRHEKGYPKCLESPSPTAPLPE